MVFCLLMFSHSGYTAPFSTVIKSSTSQYKDSELSNYLYWSLLEIILPCMHLISKPEVRVWCYDLISSPTQNPPKIATGSEVLNYLSIPPGGAPPELFIFNELCAFKDEPGPCKAIKERFFFNVDSGHCELFEYGGCGGNANNFLTLEACEETCVVSGESDTYSNKKCFHEFTNIHTNTTDTKRYKRERMFCSIALLCCLQRIIFVF